jgi:branched-chain amino acid transport system ATP-binding protein
MEKMNRKNIQRLIAKAEKEKGNIEFYEMNLPIIIDILKTKNQKKIERWQYQSEVKKLKTNIALGQLKGYPEALKTAQIEDLDQAFSLKARAIKQKMKRAQKKNQSLSTLEKKLSDLALKKETALKKINDQFELKKVPESRQALTQKIEQIDQKRIKREQALLALEEKIIQKWTIFNQKRLHEAHTKLEMYLKEIHHDDQNVNPNRQLSEDAILRLDHISMQFGGLKAVNDLSFEVKKGEIFGLIGPNGAGKTTIFNCITRFYMATEGNIYYRNHYNHVISLNDFIVHNVIKQGIVRTFQNVELIWELNVIDNLLVGAHKSYQTGFFQHMIQSKRLKQEEQVQRAKAYQILESLELTPYAYMYPLGLPYGILKKVELARTLMTNPKLIILDEPAAGLNDLETEALAKTIKKIRDDYQTTIFLVEHDMGLVMDICDTVCAISFGKKLAIGTPKEIQQNKIVREAYLGGE